MQLFDGQARKIDTNDIAWVEKVLKLKERSASNPWPVIEECINFWVSKKPHEYKSHLIDVNSLRETRKEKKFASTTDPVTGGIMRYVLSIPDEVIFMIRKVYNADELPMNRLFFLEWFKKFPKMTVSERN